MDAVKETEWMLERFEEHRDHLRAVAYRMLGSSGEADDAVQETWLRLSRTDTSDVDNLGGWLTTVVARVCLNVLRARSVRRAEPLDDHAVVSLDLSSDPAEQSLLADSVGLALLVVLDALSPAERLAFVLHDMFAVPFEDIAPIVGRSHEATRQLASRARRRVRGASPLPDPDLARQREVVDAFFSAAHDGDFDRLVSVLHPDVVLVADGTFRVEGPATIAARASSFADPARILHPALVDGLPAVIITKDDHLVSIMAFTISPENLVTHIQTFSHPTHLLRP
jgi:RNA polymerase sigma-70 factor (ECF subfamily)